MKGEEGRGGAGERGERERKSEGCQTRRTQIVMKEEKEEWEVRTKKMKVGAQQEGGEVEVEVEVEEDREVMSSSESGGQIWEETEGGRVDFGWMKEDVPLAIAMAVIKSNHYKAENEFVASTNRLRLKGWF